MNESDFSRDVKKSIEEQLPLSWVHKNFGGPYGTGGLPDLEGIYQGRGFTIECKLVSNLPDRQDSKLTYNPFSDLQLYHLDRARKAGGYAEGLICIEFKYAIVSHANGLRLQDICLCEQVSRLQGNRWDMAFLKKVLESFGSKEDKNG